LAVSGVAEFGFELNRRFVAKRRVKALGVIDGLDERADVSFGVVWRRGSFPIRAGGQSAQWRGALPFARSSSSAAPWRLSPKPPLVRRILGPQKARIDAVELLSNLLQSRRRSENHLIGRLDAAFGRAVDDFARLDRGSALRKRGLDSR
jgi:hypothetical protein